MNSTLGIWMNGELVGHRTEARGANTLTYASSWLESDKARSRSLPVTASRVVRRFKTRNAEVGAVLSAGVVLTARPRPPTSSSCRSD